MRLATAIHSGGLFLQRRGDVILIVGRRSLPVFHLDKTGFSKRHGGRFDGRHQWLEGRLCAHRHATTGNDFQKIRSNETRSCVRNVRKMMATRVRVVEEGRLGRGGARGGETDQGADEASEWVEAAGSE